MPIDTLELLQRIRQATGESKIYWDDYGNDRSDECIHT
jgi:hypothetical protein